jgi:hypothetical protein
VKRYEERGLRVGRYCCNVESLAGLAEAGRYL